MRNLTLKILSILIIFVSIAKAQSDSLYHIELHTAGSPILSIYEEERYPGAPDNFTFGYGMHFRAMWHPGRLLAFGLMSGYLFIAEDEIKTNYDFTASQSFKARARLNAIPLQVVVSMQKNNLEFGLGMGPYVLLSTIELGKTATGHRYELGLTFFGSYMFSLDDNIFLGPELRAFYLSYRGIFSVMTSISFRFNIWSY